MQYECEEKRVDVKSVYVCMYVYVCVCVFVCVRVYMYT